MGYPDSALKHVETTLKWADALSHPYSLAHAHCYAAIVYELLGDAERVAEHAEELVTGSSEHELTVWLSNGQSMQGWALAELGRLGEAVDLMREALEVIKKTGEQRWQAMALVTKAKLMLTDCGSSASRAEAILMEAMEIARNQQGRYFELMAANRLAELWHKQGKATEARNLLLPCYQWFTEGFDTAELNRARTLLDRFGRKLPGAGR